MNHPFEKINFDGSIQGSSTSTGFVIRDVNADPLFATSKYIGPLYVLVAEALALRETLSQARGFTHIAMEGDSKILIDCLKGQYCIPWRILFVIEDIH